VWALVETALGFPSNGGYSAVHGCGSVHAVVELTEDARNLHHLTGHYPLDILSLGDLELGSASFGTSKACHKRLWRMSPRLDAAT